MKDDSRRARRWRACSGQDRAGETCALLEPYVFRGTADTEVLMLYDHAPMSLSKTDAVVEAFRTIVAREPDNAGTRLRLATALAVGERSEEAEAEARGYP